MATKHIRQTIQTVSILEQLKLNQEKMIILSLYEWYNYSKI
jgi:hypothetical protein